MIKNIKVYSLFEGFLETLDQNKLSVHERKFINLIKSDFDNIASLGTFNGQRAKSLVSLIERNGGGIDDVVSLKSRGSSKTGFPLKHLTSLRVDKFRGFSNAEEFLFEKKYTLVYGPNGSGKSSFCDALEYALLGYINEATSKRIDVEKYIRNADLKAFEKPIVKGLDHSGKSIDVAQMPDVYNFCFIEKNRISDFSRISANTPAGQKGLLSILFGLEDFNKFAMYFTANFGEYIDVKGKKKAELDIKKQEIAEAEIKVKSAKENQVKLEEEKAEFVLRVKLGKSFEEVEVYLYGNQSPATVAQQSELEIGRIKVIELALSKPLSEKYYTKKFEDIDGMIILLESNIKKYKEKESDYAAKKDAVTYKKLYSAIMELEKESKDKCPACHTPVDKSIVNPFVHARVEIQKLGEIAKLESELESLWNSINLSKSNLAKEVSQLSAIATKLACDLEAIEIEEISGKSKGEALVIIESFIKSIRGNSANCDSLFTQSEEENRKFLEIATYRAKLVAERTNLLTQSDVIKGIKTRATLFAETVAREAAVISKFAEANKELIEQVESEKLKLVENQKFLDAYNSIIGKLKEYNEGLPVKMVENLNDLTKEFYNSINRNDKKYELLESVELPVSAEGSIKIKFKDNPAEYDALHILSEGHIRCLGLAILLAKVVVDEKGIIIFDDVVNAIDDEHREGIRELLFKDERIKEKQIILTSHAEEFIKDLDNQFKVSEYQNLVKRITFLRSPDVRSILVDAHECTFNYLTKAESCLARENKRDGLMNCRRALENITNGLWSRLGKKTYKIDLTVKLRAPKTSPDLMGVVHGLRKFMEANQFFSKETTDQIVDDFKYLEGLDSANKNIWNYLNKGTHEESDSKEFDKAIVERILDRLKRLDENVKQDRETVSA